MLIISVFLSLVLIVSVYFTYSSEKELKVFSAVIAFGGLFLGAFCQAFPICILAVLIIPALFIWKKCQWSPVSLFGYMFGTAVLANGLAVLMILQYVSDMERLQLKYPFESMAERLPVPKTNAVTPLSNESAEQLSELERTFGTDFHTARDLSLQNLHQDSVKHFIDSPGFGVGRGPIRPSEERLAARRFDRRETPLPQPNARPWSTLAEGDLRVLPDLNPAALRTMHLNSIIDFVNPEAFGLIISRQKVAGFLPHQFYSVPQAKEWNVQTVELLGLLMHEEPVIYVSDELPNMENARTMPTRPLNVFETAGLKRLQEGDDLFVRETNDDIRMLGAVRSIAKCVQCHGGERGELLGAFSYSLQRAK
jgi:hypothetical protein